MKRKKISQILMYLFAFIVMAGCNTQDETKEYSFQKIEREISVIINNSDNQKEIDMTSLTPFRWTDLYIIEPYSSVEEINNQLGFIWDDVEEAGINNNDEFNFLVFVEGKEVVNYIKWPRSKGDFSKNCSIKLFS